MKLYLHYETGEDDNKVTTKLTVPKSWYSKPVSAVIALFCESYNKKNEQSPLQEGLVHLSNSEGQGIYSDSVISDALSDHGDFFIKHGPLVKKKADSGENGDSKSLLLRCKNYGCGKSYSEAENGDLSCSHHSGPPVFHDTIKFWSCCPERKAYDWDDFQLISGCVQSKHSTIDPKIALGSVRSNASTDESKASFAPQPVIKSIADYNKENPDAATAAQSAVRTIAPAERKSSRHPSDGTARCKNKGCQAVFTVAENNINACRFHAGQVDQPFKLALFSRKLF